MAFATMCGRDVGWRRCRNRNFAKSIDSGAVYANVMSDILFLVSG